MNVIIWEYLVKAECVTEFERIYSADGAWTKLFKKSSGFIGTELLRDKKQTHRYITIDRWNSLQEYESFLLQWQSEYEALDAKCNNLTEQETLLGKWESIRRETQ